MATRGRKPKPTAVKKRAGNPGKRKLGKKTEPKPKVAALPEPPEHLAELGKQCWEYYAEHLHKLGLLSTIDLFAFEGFCFNYGRYVEAELAIEEEGAVLETFSTWKKNPWVDIGRAARNDCLKFATEFGLTPSSRTRIDVVPPKPEDRELSDFEKFVAARGKGPKLGVG